MPAERDLRAELVREREVVMQLCEPVPVDAEIASLIPAIEHHFNARGGEDTIDQIVAVTVQAYRRASTRRRTQEAPTTIPRQFGIT